MHEFATMVATGEAAPLSTPRRTIRPGPSRNSPRRPAMPETRRRTGSSPINEELNFSNVARLAPANRVCRRAGMPPTFEQGRHHRKALCVESIPRAAKHAYNDETPSAPADRTKSASVFAFIYA